MLNRPLFAFGRVLNPNSGSASATRLQYFRSSTECSLADSGPSQFPAHSKGVSCTAKRTARFLPVASICFPTSDNASRTNRIPQKEVGAPISSMTGQPAILQGAIIERAILRQVCLQPFVVRSSVPRDRYCGIAADCAARERRLLGGDSARVCGRPWPGGAGGPRTERVDPYGGSYGC